MSPPSKPPSDPPPPSSSSATPPAPPSSSSTPLSTKGPASKKPPKVKQHGLYRNWVSYAGGLFASGSLMLILVLIVLEASQSHPSPYLGIFTFLIVPDASSSVGILVALIGMRSRPSGACKAGTTEALPYPAFDLNDPKQRKRFGYVAVGRHRAVHRADLLGLQRLSPHRVGRVLRQDVPHADGPRDDGVRALAARAASRCVECHVGDGAGSYVALEDERHRSR